jgi:membrane protease YdiL (CAAX protease family)
MSDGAPGDRTFHEGRDGAVDAGLSVEVERGEDAPSAPAEETGADILPVPENSVSDVEPFLITPPIETGAAFLVDTEAGSEDGFDGRPQFRFAEPYLQPVYQIPGPPARHPNFADASLFLVLLTMGLLVTTGLLGAALYFHWLGRWFGLKNFEEAAKSTPIALGTQLLIYLIGLAGAVPFFRMIWGKGYFDGLHWHGGTAYRLRYRLVGAAVLCNVLAMVGNWLLPFPQHAPIDKLFSTSTDAWMLACFGVTIAPFFEEMIFRGFFLPAVATAWDWIAERTTGRSPRPLDAAGNPQWSLGAVIFASLVVSAPFALMHSAQVGQAWGPLLLLYCISLILCSVRLVTRSLAASTLVHSAYNFMLFAVMFAQSDGFRHMDKM